uniref:Carboxypeptidase n=1 Tax=Dionaea muscipula TaxID=4362 RepID=A0A0S2LJ50_DIOMU|nr:serine carboxypeptitase-like protein 49 [Dionaea muscipula]
MENVIIVYSSLLLVLVSSSSYSAARLLAADHGAAPAEKLIKAFNVFPDINIVDAGGPAGRRQLVEKRFKFPTLDYSNASLDDLGHHAGYFSLNDTYDARMFYFFFENRKNNTGAPVVVWLTGGPGCSSELAVFYENGPFKINNDMTLVWNDYGWDQSANMIFVDSPTGTGFSYSNDSRDSRHDEVGVSNDLYDFIQAFFGAHPSYASNPFFITGESYGGHYVPAFASRVNQGNKANEGTPINLKGFAIGNGLTNPGIQYAAYPDFALDNNLINQSTYDQIMQNMVPQCQSAAAACGTNGTDSCSNAANVCENIPDSILQLNPGINIYDIRKQCIGSLCYNFSNAEVFLNEPSVRSALGVGNLQWTPCSDSVNGDFNDDRMRNLEVVIPPLLEEGNIALLIYAGEDDFICNWLGNWRWVTAMEWSGQQNFNSTSPVSWQVNGTEAGILNTYGPLSFLKVHGSGHMVPMDQPEAALAMITQFIQGNLTSQ